MNTLKKQVPQSQFSSLTGLDNEFRKAGEAALLVQFERMVRESGIAEDFDGTEWLSGWLATPLPALGGAKPADYMDTIEGQERISSLLAMAQSGAYA